jgi:hypothetical protein
MRPGKGALALTLTLALLGAGAVGCGEGHDTSVDEGIPLKLGDLEFNVQLTRFLNPANREDALYVAGQQVPPPSDKDYLAVFLTVKNTGGDDLHLPTVDEMEIVDTTGGTYHPLVSHSPFALPIAGIVPAHDIVPLPNSAAASGPAQGSFLLFEVDKGVVENRPLELEITSGNEKGSIKLDI